MSQVNRTHTLNKILRVADVSEVQNKPFEGDTLLRQRNNNNVVVKCNMFWTTKLGISFNNYSQTNDIIRQDNVSVQLETILFKFLIQ